MNIPIPRLLVRGWQAFYVWANVPIGHLSFELLRIDLLAAALWLVTIAWYGYRYGVRGAVMGGFMFAVMASLALFLRPPSPPPAEPPRT